MYYQEHDYIRIYFSSVTCCPSKCVLYAKRNTNTKGKIKNKEKFLSLSTFLKSFFLYFGCSFFLFLFNFFFFKKLTKKYLNSS